MGDLGAPNMVHRSRPLTPVEKNLALIQTMIVAILWSRNEQSLVRQKPLLVNLTQAKGQCSRPGLLKLLAQETIDAWERWHPGGGVPGGVAGKGRGC